MTPSPRLLLADYAPTRAGIRIALEPDVTICAEADGLETAVQAARAQQPDLCLVRLALFTDGARAVRAICRAAPATAVVVLSDDVDAADMVECIRAGAVGYASGAVDARRLRRIVGAVAGGEAVIPRGMVLDLLAELRGLGAGGTGLTRREAEVLAMLRRGHTTAEIAQRLEIAPVTVRRHISALVSKLGVQNRSALLAIERAADRRLTSLDRSALPAAGRSGQTAADRVNGRVDAVGDPELGQDAGYVVLRGTGTDVKRSGDRGVVAPLRDQAQDVELARGQSLAEDGVELSLTAGVADVAEQDVGGVGRKPRRALRG